jgi:hypothetical protein
VTSVLSITSTVVPRVILNTELGYTIGTWKLVTRSKFPPPMSNTASELGTCPFCGSKIQSGALLIEYEVAGETRFFAECYECDEPVKPH